MVGCGVVCELVVLMCCGCGRWCYGCGGGSWCDFFLLLWVLVVTMGFFLVGGGFEVVVVVGLSI